MMALAVSDAVLAACALTAWLTIARASVMRAAVPPLLVGWGLIAAAAVLGMIRFGGVAALEPAHRLLSSCAAGLGLPLVAGGLALAFHRPRASVSAGYWTLAAVSMAALIASLIGMARLAAAVSTLVLAAWIAARPGLDATDRRTGLLAVAALLAAAGFARAGPTPLALSGLHYALAIAQLAWLWQWRRRASGLAALDQKRN